MKRLSFVVFAAAVLATVAVVAGLAPAVSAAGGPPPGGDRGSVVATERRTAAFFDALSAQDLASVTGMLRRDVTWSVPMAASGDNATGGTVLTGRDAVLAHFTEIQRLVRTVRFVDRRISVVNGGGTSFMQAGGDFETAAGMPYRNVYVFRLDWREGKVVSAVEYANPVTICSTFPLPDCPQALR